MYRQMAFLCVAMAHAIVWGQVTENFDTIAWPASWASSGGTSFSSGEIHSGVNQTRTITTDYFNVLSDADYISMAYKGGLLTLGTFSASLTITATNIANTSTTTVFSSNSFNTLSWGNTGNVTFPGIGVYRLNITWTSGNILTTIQMDNFASSASYFIPLPEIDLQLSIENSSLVWSVDDIDIVESIEIYAGVDESDYQVVEQLPFSSSGTYPITSGTYYQIKLKGKNGAVLLTSEMVKADTETREAMIYPNPVTAGTHIHVTPPDAQSSAMLILYSGDGQEVSTLSYNAENPYMLTPTTPGIYLLKIIQGNTVHTEHVYVF